jgi:hypothetical protein
MDGHARPVELSEWQELLGAFQGRFRRPDGRKALEHYTIGLLTELPNQNGDTLAQAVQGAVNSSWPWRTIRWRHGTNGWRRKKFVAGRGWRVTSEGPRHKGWLVGERAPQGQPEDRHYFCRNLPPPRPSKSWRVGLGPVPGAAVAGLSSACRDGHAGL